MDMPVEKNADEMPISQKLPELHTQEMEAAVKNVSMAETEVEVLPHMEAPAGMMDVEMPGVGAPITKAMVTVEKIDNWEAHLRMPVEEMSGSPRVEEKVLIADLPVATIAGLETPMRKMLEEEEYNGEEEDDMFLAEEL